jgi:hypothetical protein
MSEFIDLIDHTNVFKCLERNYLQLRELNFDLNFDDYFKKIPNENLNKEIEDRIRAEMSSKYIDEKVNSTQNLFLIISILFMLAVW